MKGLFLVLIGFLFLVGCVEPQVKPEEFWNRHLENIMPEIAELREKEAAAKESEENLSRIQITETNLDFVDLQYRMQPRIRIAVVNETDTPISRVHMEAVVETPGRSVSWLEAPITYQVPGGLEPGESAKWELMPSNYRGWHDLPQDRDDLVLTVKIVGLDGPDEAPIWNTKFTEEDQERLAGLLAILERIEANLYH